MFVHAGTAFHRHEFSAPLDTRSSSAASHRHSLQRSAFPAPPRNASPPLNRRPLSDVPRRVTDQPVVRFQGPETDAMSEETLANSDTSEVPSSELRSRRRLPRTSTTFHLAHPAPTLTQKQKLIHIPPRLLLQLQRLSPGSRPEPAVDVLPSAAGITRLAQKFPRMFRGKAALGTNDVMIVRSEEYDPAASDDEDDLGGRDLLAVICQMPKDAGGLQGKAEIVLSDGAVWVASPRSSNIYEFVSVDENGHRTTARWVKRSTVASGDSAESGHAALKYTFSIIDPSSRRHPILGTLTQSTLDIPDFYTSVSASAKKYPPPTQGRPLSADPDSMDDEPTPERTTHVVHEETKRLIQVTGIWVALREGLSPYFKYNDSAAGSSARAMCPATALHGRVRSVSLTPDARRPAVAASTTSAADSCQLVAAGNKLKRACTTGPASAAAPPRVKVNVLPSPQRSTSAGTAFMQRVAARRISRPGTIQSESDAESDRRRSRPYTIEYGPGAAGTPSSVTLQGSPVSTPDTPTQPPRRVQSAHLSSRLPLTEQIMTPEARRSLDVVSRELDLKLEWVAKPKVKLSRWKSFTNHFRRPQSRPPAVRASGM